MGLHPRMGWEKAWGELLPSASALGALLQLCVHPLQPYVCTHCSPAAQNAALGHCCSSVHPPAAALVCLMLSWVTAAALCVHPLQSSCTECCPWTLLQPFACTHCTAGAPNIALGHCCSPMCALTAALLHLTLPLAIAAALCIHLLQPWCV